MMNTNKSLDEKNVLITGASRRIGKEIAKILHNLGMNIGIHCNKSINQANELQAILNKSRNNSAKVFIANLKKNSEIKQLINDFSLWRNTLDVLINNASSFYPTPIGKITKKQWNDLIGINLKAPLFLSQQAFPFLRTSQGTIINIIDIHATQPLANHIVYSSAKAGLKMITRSLAKDLAPNVRVNGISPGAILWPENNMNESLKENILQKIPMQRSGSPEDIADCITFLIRDASYITGQIITIDGGRSFR